MIIDATTIDYFAELRNEITKISELRKHSKHFGGKLVAFSTLYFKPPQKRQKKTL